MTGSSTPAPRYDDEEFLAVLDLYNFATDDWIGTHEFAASVGCKMLTANRRLLALAAREDGIEVYDPEAGDGETGEAVAPGPLIEEDTGRLLGFRREPDDPESAPDYLDTGVKRL